MVAAALANWKMDLFALVPALPQKQLAQKSAETEKISLREPVKTEMLTMVMDAVQHALLRQDINVQVVHLLVQTHVTNSLADMEPCQEDGTPHIAKIATKLVEMDAHLDVY